MFVWTTGWQGLCFPFTVILPKQSQPFATRDSFFFLLLLFLLKVSDKIFSPWFLNWWNPWRFALCGSFNGCGFRSLFHFAALLTGSSRTKYRQQGAWPDHGLIWSFHFSGELGARGQSQAHRFAACLQYLHAINSLAVTVFV